MKTDATPIERPEAPRAEQLTLLSAPESDSTAVRLKPSSAHARFQLSRSARARGLAHVAEIRRQLVEAKAARESAAARKLPLRPHRAA